LRHLAAYAELAGQDLQQTERDIGTRLLASVVFGVCLFFAVFSGCLVVVALTWDTPYRVSALEWMGGVFSLLAIIAGFYRSAVIGAQAPFLGTVRREWAEDRIILERILSDQD